MGQRLPNLADSTSRVSQRSSAAAAKRTKPCRLGSDRRMSNPFRTPEDYELFLYTLTEQFPSIRRSTPPPCFITNPTPPPPRPPDLVPAPPPPPRPPPPPPPPSSQVRSSSPPPPRGGSGFRKLRGNGR